MLHAVANWWDSVELWITQLAFPFQVVLAIVILLPLCAGFAIAFDHASDLLDGWLGRGEGAPASERTRGKER